MHEASLVASLLRQIHELAAEHGGGSVTEVRVEIGPLAGVEPLLFFTAFRQLRQGTIAATAELVVEPIPLSCRCRRCSLDYTSTELRFVCPHCQADDIDVLRGDVVTLVSMTLTPCNSPALT